MLRLPLEDRLLIAGAALLPIAAFAMARVLLPFGAETWDLKEFLLPWMREVQARGASSISGDFTLYMPPYIYLMYLVSGLVPLVGAVAAIKLITVPFVIAGAVGVGATVWEITRDWRRALLAGATIFVAPTVMVNAFLWGQADTIYTCFLVYFVLFAVRGSFGWAAAMFGIALSFKLQAMFLSPLLLYLFLSGQMRFTQALLAPAAFLLMLVPAAIAGRPIDEMLTTYVAQGQFYQVLSNFAPNPWRFLQRVVSYPVGTAIGLVAAALTGLALALVPLRGPRGPVPILVLAVLCAVLMPYVLPKMHDRYFFVADMLSIPLAFVLPRYWAMPVLFQLGSLTAYLRYLMELVPGPSYGFVGITLGLGLALLAAHERLGKRSSTEADAAA